MADKRKSRWPNRAPFVLSCHDTIGSIQAEMDEQFLHDCFVDNGYLNIIKDCANPKAIVVGRTGSGKSALLLAIKRTQEHVVVLSPHSLSLQYVSNSDILNFFNELGVKLNLFFRLLWRHV